MQKKQTKYIFVVGGVMSGVGKGIATASIGKILQSRGVEVTAVKIDPYVNVDAGTMNPTEHGEVFVLDDGMGPGHGELREVSGPRSYPDQLHDHRKRLSLCNSEGAQFGIWRQASGSRAAHSA